MQQPLTGCAVANERVVGVGDPIGRRRGVGVQQRVRHPGEESKVALEDAAGLNAIFKEEGVAHDIIRHIVGQVHPESYNSLHVKCSKRRSDVVDQRHRHIAARSNTLMRCRVRTHTMRHKTGPAMPGSASALQGLSSRDGAWRSD